MIINVPPPQSDGVSVNDYVWAKCALAPGVVVADTATDVPIASSGTVTVPYSNVVTVTDGKVSLVDTLGSQGISTSNYWDYRYQFRGVYFQVNNNVYLGTQDDLTKREGIVYQKAYACSVASVPVDAVNSYLSSPDQSAYPPPINDGYYYQLLGSLGSAVGFHWDYGTYIGSGKAGADNPNSLTFSFAPKVVMILPTDGSLFITTGTSLSYNRIIQHVPSMPTTFTYGYGFGSRLNQSLMGKRSEDGKTVSWYTTETDPTYQNNTLGGLYYYIAFG
nr:MAG TPA: hypothetical protein [Bacteriophage sp.]